MMEVVGAGDLDSDREDDDPERQLGRWLDQLDIQQTMVHDTDGFSTVKRRQKTVVTSEMALESFRYSFINENPENVSLDAILGELTELEQQLSVQCDLSNTLIRKRSNLTDDYRDSGNDLSSNQSDLDSLTYDLLQNSNFECSRDFAAYDIAETDSAFGDNSSLPSSGSYTSMVTVSSSADTSSSGETYNNGVMHPVHPQPQTVSPSQIELKTRLKEEKIRIALEKIKDGNFKKLFVRAYSRDGSSKSIMVDETMTVGQVCAVLAEKNHQHLTLASSVVEQLPELYMERTLEDHDSVVENMVLWTHDSSNRIVYDDRHDKYDLFLQPERYLLPGNETSPPLDPDSRAYLVQDFFSGGNSRVPDLEGPLYLKTEGKKSWKKYYCVLRSSGLYYNAKGKMSKAAKDLSCLAQMEYVDIYQGINWKKKYNSPTDFTFALKHPQIQKKASKYIRYFCVETEEQLMSWLTGLRIAKYGKQLYDNYETRQVDIASWDIRDEWTESHRNSSHMDTRLHDSQLSLPSSTMSCSDGYSSVSNISDSPLRSSTTTLIGEDAEVIANGMEHDMDALLLIQKAPVKRVSFSTTHSIINTEQTDKQRHRDSITSSSTDTSDESTSSAESRGSQPRKLRAKIPLTTGTTRFISEMCQNSLDNPAMSSIDGTVIERKPFIQNSALRISQRRKSAPTLDINEVDSGTLKKQSCNSPLKQKSCALHLNSQDSLNDIYHGVEGDSAVTPTNQHSQLVDGLSQRSSYMSNCSDSSTAYENFSPSRLQNNYQSVRKSSQDSAMPVRQSYQHHRKSLSSSSVPPASVILAEQDTPPNPHLQHTLPNQHSQHMAPSQHSQHMAPSQHSQYTPPTQHPQRPSQPPPLPPNHPAMIRDRSDVVQMRKHSAPVISTGALSLSNTHNININQNNVAFQNLSQQHSNSPTITQSAESINVGHNIRHDHYDNNQTRSQFVSLPPPTLPKPQRDSNTPPPINNQTADFHQPSAHNPIYDSSLPIMPSGPPLPVQTGISATMPPTVPTQPFYDTVSSNSMSSGPSSNTSQMSPPLPPPPTAAKPQKTMSGPPPALQPLILSNEHQQPCKSPPVVAPKPQKRDQSREVVKSEPPPTPSPDYNLNSPITFDETESRVGADPSNVIPSDLPRRQSKTENIYSKIDEKVAQDTHPPSNSIHNITKNDEIYAIVNKNSQKPNSPLPSSQLPSCAKVSVPPAPPKRSDTTRLSKRGPRPQLTKSDSVSSSDSSISRESANSHDVFLPPQPDPLTMSMCDAILPLDDLPLPPPELLEGLSNDDPTNNCNKNIKCMPPPLPVRSKDTQLTSTSSSKS